MARRLKHWGWGYEDQQPAHADIEALARSAPDQLGFGDGVAEPFVPIEDVVLPRPRIAPPASLDSICTSDVHTRALHTYGRAYRDIVRAFRGRFDNPPDLVARPRTEQELEQVLEWCAETGAAAIPFGGGTSVVGGVEARVGEGYSGAVSIDLKALDRVLEIDRPSRAALIQGGATGPVLEDQLREHDLTLRHYPQSFEYSTLGGWIATRAGGHFATMLTHIDDLVESVRAITPTGVWESRRLPGSGAGPSPDRMLIGSEGTLGVITQAWVRLQDRPRFKASVSVGFDDFHAGAEAVRALSQGGLWPANCRLLDEAEAALNGAAEQGALLVLGFESAHHPVDRSLERALESCTDHGGRAQAPPRYVRPDDDAARGQPPDGAAAWRDSFLQMPYIRDSLIAAGVLAETFETAITWDRLESFVAGVREAVEGALATETGGGRVSCRFTHVYPDGAAPYFTVLAPARRGSELEQWDAVKAIASEAIESAGGTITHHHAVGRDHRPWYDRQRPDPFAAAMVAAKRAVDPEAILNPGVLFDAAR